MALDNQVDAFARLQRLRAQGLLTDEEYEREKAALRRGAPDELQLTWRDRWKAGREATRDMRRSLRWSFVGCILVVALISTYFFGKAASLAETRGELSSSGGGASATAADPSQGEAGSSDLWAIDTSSDPMTDATVRKASATFEGEQFDAQVAVTCTSAGDLSYTAASYDKEGAPAEMRSRVIPFGYAAGTWIDYQMRADGEPARSLSTFNPAYNNQVVLKTEEVGPLYADGSGVDDTEQMAAASRVTLRLLLTSGEETFALPQSDNGFRSVVQPCLEQRQAKRQQLTAQRQAAEAEDRAGKAADIDRLYDDAAVDADTLVWMANNRNIPVDDARLAAKRAREAGKPRPAESPNVVSGM